MSLNAIMQLVIGAVISSIFGVLFWSIKRSIDNDRQDTKKDIQEIKENIALLFEKLNILTINLLEWKKEIVEVHVRGLETKIADNKNDIIGLKKDVENLKDMYDRRK
jgi:uncharacterized membrane protein YgaE (UPF0421/DUF939 family)